MSDDDFMEKVTDWVETSGRALELRTARIFRSAPGAARYVRQSEPYEDPKTQATREGDVLAIYRSQNGPYSISLEAAVECKGGKDKPWVAFYDNFRGIPDIATYWLMLSDGWGGPVVDQLLNAWVARPSLMTDRVATHAVSALGNESKNFVHDAARQAVSFAVARKSRPVRYSDAPEESEPVTAVAPVVVTQAPLFTCELDSQGEVVVERVDRFDMWVHSGRYTRRRVYVRNEASAAELAEGMDRVHADLISA